jgi:heme exporter protein B
MSDARLAWEQLLAIVGKDLRTEVRSKQIWIAMGLFAALVLVIFSFALDLHVENTAAVAPGALWVAVVFASVLGLGRTVALEQDKGSMDRLLLCPVDRQLIFVAKLIGNLIFIGAVELVAVPLFAVIYNLPVLTLPVLPILVLGTVGVATIGTVFSVVAANTRAREVLLPLLLFPLLVPVVIGAVRATQGLITPVAGDAPWLGLLLAFDVIFVSIATVVFQYVVEE